MSVRAVAVRTVPRARFRVVSRELPQGRSRLLEADTHGDAARRHSVPSGLLRRWADDRQMIRLKLCVLAALVLLAMALEVPL